MKRIKLLLLSAFVCIGITSAIAQTKVTGKVTSSEDGQPIPGVTVIVKGLSGVGTTTNIDGVFTLNVPASGKILTFSYIGYQSQDVSLSGSANLKVVLVSETKKLDEVVVTALGVRRSEKALGYAATSVSSDDIGKARESNVMGSLQGKVAGAQISSNGGTPGASTKVILRGYASLTGNNNPLYVVDGTPIDNTQNTSNGVDFGNGANGINPDDVENVTVLKGASATALYGSRASSGVIMITTKSGKNSKDKIKVSYSSNATFSNLLRLPDFQNTFGQGWSGRFAFEENGSWGPKYDGKLRPWGAIYYPDNSQQLKKFVALENNVKDFYETGTSFTNSVSISGGNEKSNFYLSYSNTRDDGIVPDNTDYYRRNNFSVKGSTKVNKWTLSGTVNYVKQNSAGPSDGRGGTAAAANLYSEILQIPRDISIVDMKDYKNNPFNTEDYFFTVYAANPYFAFHENSNKFNEDRFYGNASISHQTFSWLKQTLRVGSDVSSYQTSSWEAKVAFKPESWALNNPGSKKKDNPGYYSEEFGTRREVNVDYLLESSGKVIDDVTYNALLGLNINQRTSSYINHEINSLDVPYYYDIKNTNGSVTAESYETKRRLIGAFAQADFSYRDKIFLTGTFRQDWSSTLPNHKPYNYPGVNTSFLMHEIFPMIKDYIPFAKLRVSWGKTGKDAPVYMLKSVFQQASIYNPFGNYEFPTANGVNAYELGTRIGNPDLKPEISSEIEFGADVRLFNNRIGIDVAYYKKNTKDQILDVPITTSSGYAVQAKNLGEVQNKGVELTLTLVPVRLGRFEWTSVITYSRNRGKVVKLSDGLDEVRLANSYDVDFVAVKGYPVGVFKGPDYRYDPQGHIVVGSDGMPLQNSEKGIYGNAERKYMMGISNTFKYGNLSLGFTFDIRKGGMMYSGTADLQYFVGNAPQTTYNDREPFIVPNSVYGVEQSDGTWVYSENTTPIDRSNYNAYFYSTKNPNSERDRVIDKSYVRLNEVNLTYNLPKRWFGNLPVETLSLALYGKNLLLWTPTSNNFIDPEVTSWGNDLAGEFGEFRTNPSLRSFGVSLKVNF